MKSNTRVNKKKPVKNSALNTKNLDKEKKIPEDTARVGKAKVGKKPIENSTSSTNFLEQDDDVLESRPDFSDLWMLKYDINERGIGKILLPPSLSTLLQSDRVSISPTAGGLFIRSV